MYNFNFFEVDMKRSLVGLLIIASMVCLTNSFAMPNTVQKIKQPVRSCLDPRFTQYFKFDNQNQNGVMYIGMHLGLDSGPGYYNLLTNLNEITPIDPNKQSQVYKINFTGNKAVMTGELESVSSSAIEAMCGLTFSCECDGSACEAWIETIGGGSSTGSRCNIAGTGTETDPYVIQLN